MPLETVYRITCDSCGRQEIFVGSNEIQAIWFAREKGWQQKDLNIFYCNDCIE